VPLPAPPGGDASPAAAGSAEALLASWDEPLGGASADAPAVPPAFVLAMAGMFLHLRGNLAEAMGCYDYSLQLQPSAGAPSGGVAVLLKRASLWYEREELPKAHADFATAEKLEPRCADIYCHRGQLHILQNELSSALTDLRQAVDLDKQGEDDAGAELARVQLGMALHRHGQQSEARRVFGEAEEDFPSSPDVLNYHGELLTEAGQLDEAKAKFRAALALSSNGFALAHVNLGVLELTGAQNLDKALEHCAQAVAADALCETAHVHMAHLWLQKMDLKAAVESYDRAVALLRMKQELVDCFSMREATATQVKLLEAQPHIYGPAMQQHRERFAEMAAGGAM